MTDLLSTQQVNQIREVFHDLSETFAFPAIVRRTTFTNGAFRADPTTEDFSFNAIRDFQSAGETDQIRNDLGTDVIHERKLYIHWDDFLSAGLIDTENKVLLDHNDVVLMENEIYDIVSFGGIAEMTKQPSFVYLMVKRRFANPDGGAP